MNDAASLRVCVCVPARDEAKRLPKLLSALAAQDWPVRLSVVVALNNTTDGSLAVLESAAREFRDALQLHVDEQLYAASIAHAGTARRRAMDLGVAVVGGADNAILLTTDADARPPKDWVRRNVEAIDRGVDLVGGALVLDDEEPISQLTEGSWAALGAYWRAVRAIEDELDPIAWDPAPRHGDHTGGSLATTVAAYQAAGGVPAVPIGEDAAFVVAARAKGFRLAHPIDVWTRVSPRIDARAQGGMASKMKALAGGEPGAMAVPSLDQWRERAEWRRDVRRAGGDAAVAAQEPSLPPMRCDVVIAPVSPEVAA